jgi:hypothetical protein
MDSVRSIAPQRQSTHPPQSRGRKTPLPGSSGRGHSSTLRLSLPWNQLIFDTHSAAATIGIRDIEVDHPKLVYGRSRPDDLRSMIMMRWHVRFTPAELPSPTSPLPLVAELPVDWKGWLHRADVVPRTPFLLSPSYEYDLVLNEFFQSVEMVGSAWNTQVWPRFRRSCGRSGKDGGGATLSGTAFGAVMPRRWVGGPAEPATAGAARSVPRAPGDQRLEGGLQPPQATLRARLPGASCLRCSPHPSMIDSRGLRHVLQSVAYCGRPAGR